MNNLVMLEEMVLFAAVIRCQSFSAAAREFKLAKSTVSQRISKLEKQLGIQLINRTTRQLHLTKSGDILYKHCQTILQNLQLAQHDLEQHMNLPVGRLKITSPEITGLHLLKKYIPEFKLNYPKIDIDLIITDEQLDITKQKIDFSFRTGNQFDTNLIAKHLGYVSRTLVASPEYIASSTSLNKPEDLYQHKLLKHHLLPIWKLFKNKKVKKIDLKSPFLSSNSLIYLMEMALSNMGIALLPRYLVKDAIGKKLLIEVLVEWRIKDNDYYLLFPKHNKGKAIHEVFKEFIITSRLAHDVKGY